MNTPRLIILSALVAIAALAPDLSPAMAKTKVKAKAASGVYCEQGGENIYLPISSFKPSIRSQLRVGQKSRISIAGIGPVNCRVY